MHARPQHFGECIHGVLTLRAYKRVDATISHLNTLMDTRHKGYLCLEDGMNWLQIRIGVLGTSCRAACVRGACAVCRNALLRHPPDVVCPVCIHMHTLVSLVSLCCVAGALVVGLTALSTIVLQDDIDPGMAGLAMSYSFQVFGVFGFGVMLATWLEVSMNHVDRILEYANVRLSPCAAADCVGCVRHILCLCADCMDWCGCGHGVVGVMSSPGGPGTACCD